MHLCFHCPFSTHFKPMLSIFTPYKCQKTLCFMIFPGGKERKNDVKSINVEAYKWCDTLKIKVFTQIVRTSKIHYFCSAYKSYSQSSVPLFRILEIYEAVGVMPSKILGKKIKLTSTGVSLRTVYSIEGNSQKQIETIFPFITMKCTNKLFNKSINFILQVIESTKGLKQLKEKSVLQHEIKYLDLSFARKALIM